MQAIVNNNIVRLPNYQIYVGFRLKYKFIYAVDFVKRFCAVWLRALNEYTI